MEPVAPERMPGETPLDGQAEYDAALDVLLANADRAVRIFEWKLGRGYNTPERQALMRAFLRARRTNKLTVIVQDASNLARDVPRLLELLRHFGHGLSILQTQPVARKISDPFAIADDARFTHRFHHEQPRGVASVGDINETRYLIKRFEELREVSKPAINATTLGL